MLILTNPVPSPAPSLNIPSVAGDQCASCQLSVYAIGIEGLAAACNLVTPLGTASEASVLLYDSSFNGRYSLLRNPLRQSMRYLQHELVNPVCRKSVHCYQHLSNLRQPLPRIRGRWEMLVF